MSTKAAKSYERLSEAAKLSLRIASLLGRAPVPLSLITDDPDALMEECGPLSRGLPFLGQRLLKFGDHPAWGKAVEVSTDFREYLKLESARSAERQQNERVAGVAKLADLFWNHFVWPPEIMKEQADVLEPHLQRAVEICRKYRVNDDLARIQFKRALFVSMKGENLKDGLERAREAVEAFRRSGDGQPHKGTLALLLTANAYFEELAGSAKTAVTLLTEAEKSIIDQVGEDQLPTFLVRAQLYQLLKGKAADPSNAEKAKNHALKSMKLMANGDRFSDHLEQTMPWALWHLQNYVGLDPAAPTPEPAAGE